MTHQRFTRRPGLPPAKPEQERTSKRTRAVLGRAGIGLCLVAACTSDPGHPAPAGTAATRVAPAALAAPAVSVGRAYEFLTQMLNLHNPAGTAGVADLPTLPQSYLGGVLGLEHYTVSTIYDDAVVLDAYLAMHTGWGTVRAERIGNALVYVWTRGPGRARRLFDDYLPDGLGRAGGVRLADRASSTGDVAWAGLALAQLYAATGNIQYLNTAVAVGHWIQANCVSDLGPGGYTGG